MLPKPSAETLTETLRRFIIQNGPISVQHFMAEAVQYYYAHQNPFGAQGDFITAPEISQIFGELLGLWAADAWIKLGSPTTFALIELGPGRGTLMVDALRATRHVPGFHQAMQLHLMEASPTLRAHQAQALKDFTPQWHDDLSHLPDGPFILLANEFLDALPIRQFVRRDHWYERMVGLDQKEQFCFGLAKIPAIIDLFLSNHQQNAPEGAIVELCPAARSLIGEIARHAANTPGYALFIDYGSPQSGIGDTLQAVKAHRFVDPISDPGEADLTAHVDFAALLREITSASVKSYGPLAQGILLNKLGLPVRTARLKTNASPAQKEALDRASSRLTSPDAMGTLFQSIALSSAHLPAPAAFEKF